MLEACQCRLIHKFKLLLLWSPAFGVCKKSRLKFPPNSRRRRPFAAICRHKLATSAWKPRLESKKVHFLIHPSIIFLFRVCSFTVKRLEVDRRKDVDVLGAFFVICVWRAPAARCRGYAISLVSFQPWTLHWNLATSRPIFRSNLLIIVLWYLFQPLVVFICDLCAF